MTLPADSSRGSPAAPNGLRIPATLPRVLECKGSPH